MERASRPLAIAHVDAETGFSGGEVQVFLLLDGLAARGHRSLLVVPPRSRAAAEARRRGHPVAEVAMRSDLDLPAVLSLRSLLRRGAFDLVHLHTGRATWLGGLAARLAGVPALTTRRMDRPVRPGWRTRLVYRRLVRRAAAISPAVLARLRAGGVPAERLRLIPSAVDDSRLAAPPLAPGERAAVRAAFGADPDAPVLLALASLVPRKGLDVLLDALARLAPMPPGLRLWIAGDGPERGALEARARAGGLAAQVRFLGRREDAERLLAACDVLVLPSRREGLGVAALEGMAAGRPIVASRVGGLAEAVGEEGEEEAGLLVPPGDPAALAAALARLLAAADLRARLAAAGPARVRARHLASQMTAAYEELYREIVAALPAR
ncbi:MAG: glycosyltransferase [Planctomycetota bacterium]